MLKKTALAENQNRIQDKLELTAEVNIYPVTTIPVGM